MEVKKGYKQTEVGVIPVDWDVKKLGEFSTPVRGGSPRPAGSSKFFNGKYIPWLTVAALTNIPSSQLYVSETDSCLTEEGSLRSRILEKGTLIIANSGATLGIAKLLSMRCCANDGIAALIEIKKDINKEYIVYYINTKTKYLREVVATGNGQPNLNTDLISNIKMPISPSLTEQNAIATALSDADELIQSQEKLIAKKRAIKQGALQDLLKPKEGWVVRRLGELADSYQKWSFTGGPFGSNLKSSDYTDEGIRIIQLQNIGDGSFINDYAIYTSKEKADELISCNIYPGEIILSKMGDPVARACIIPELHERYLMCSDGIRLAVNKKEYHPYFIYTYINSPIFRVLAENASTGSTRKRIGLNELRNIELTVPLLPEQKRIATILSDMDAEIAALEAKLAKYKQIKQGMMQNLLTGRIRLV